MATILRTKPPFINITHIIQHYEAYLEELLLNLKPDSKLIIKFVIPNEKFMHKDNLYKTIYLKYYENKKDNDNLIKEYECMLDQYFQSKACKNEIFTYYSKIMKKKFMAIVEFE